MAATGNHVCLKNVAKSNHVLLLFLMHNMQKVGLSILILPPVLGVYWGPYKYFISTLPQWNLYYPRTGITFVEVHFSCLKTK